MGCTCCGEKGLIVAGLFIGCIACLHAAPEWACTSITDNASTPLANDCRRPMSAGLYDLTANKTFVCFTGASMEPIVAAYNHGSNTWSTPVGIGIPEEHAAAWMIQELNGDVIGKASGKVKCSKVLNEPQHWRE
jgi:hypothetical protein